MPSPAPTAITPRKLLRRFRRDRRGSAAVEFAMIATPFFALLFAIIETSIVFFAGQVLETGVQDSARLIFTHQFQDSSSALTKTEQQQKFKTDLCNRVSILMNCSVLEFDVKFYAAGTPINITDPIDGAGNFTNAGFDFVTPPNGSTATVVVRAFYQWPLYVTGLGYNIANVGRNTSNKKRLLAATAAFHVEP